MRSRQPRGVDNTVGVATNCARPEIRPTHPAEEVGYTRRRGMCRKYADYPRQPHPNGSGRVNPRSPQRNGGPGNSVRNAICPISKPRPLSRSPDWTPPIRPAQCCSGLQATGRHPNLSDGPVLRNPPHVSDLDDGGLRSMVRNPHTHPVLDACRLRLSFFLSGCRRESRRDGHRRGGCACPRLSKNGEALLQPSQPPSTSHRQVTRAPRTI